jgi:hypothetical protein
MKQKQARVLESKGSKSPKGTSLLEERTPYYLVPSLTASNLKPETRNLKLPGKAGATVSLNI